MDNYIYNVIIPEYSCFDAAHREDHATTVIDQAMKLLDEMPLWLSQQNDADEQWKVDVNRNILKMAAACHDLGLIRGRESNMPNINVAGTDARYIFYY